VRVAWFSPMPPVRSGIAACSAQLVPALRTQAGISRVDVFVDEPLAASPDVTSAHEFPWRHRIAPYDLTVYQVGNSSHHDYLWPYLFRFPGLAVLHDPHLHHARAAALLRTRRYAHYRSEFAANHPDTPAGAAELAIAGFDSHLYYMWPMARLVVQASLLSGVHTRGMAERLRTDLGSDRIEYLRLSQGTLVTEERERAARARVRGRYNIPADAVTFGCFGGLTPDKRLPQILDAFSALRAYLPESRLVLAGAPAEHYDLVADVRARGLQQDVVITGYLDTDEDLTDCIAAVDVTLNLRWPTARELSGPWLRSLAAGKPSIVTDVMHMVDVASLDPRTWSRNGGGSETEEPVAVAIDILDEDHSLRLAMKRLGSDPALRHTLGRAARSYWLREHSPEAMLADYIRLMSVAQSLPSPVGTLPVHLVDDGTRLLQTLIAPFGIAAPLA
jgi:glycosyltransferase involved in cell wall biosynthesis